jgi:hypothetical protein
VLGYAAAMRLELSKCVIRPLHFSDAASLARNGNNLHVSMNINGLPHPMTLESTQEWPKARVDQPSRFICAIEVKMEATALSGLSSNRSQKAIRQKLDTG